MIAEYIDLYALIKQFNIVIGRVFYMNREEYLSKIKEIVAEQLDKDIESLTESTAFVDDLRADSLEIVELVMALEQEFDVEMPEDAIEKVKTLGDLADVLKNL